MALADLVDNIATAIDKKLNRISLFLELEKAFDSIDHPLLSKKQWHHCIRAIVNYWLSSYLAGIKPYVEIKNCKSKLMQIMCGVPQGSILGPKLFLLYVNDICNVSSHIKYILYADDTRLLCSSNNAEKLCCNITKNLDELQTWFIVNKLSLCIDKTNDNMFSNKGIDKCNSYVKID